ncbi:MAG: GDSL-type esterase/lipase family protein [Acidimicrobiia bacterium]|nr:GDSL-type esterase/lipase family protein [Acidimicrobiia bacterium]
MANFLGTRRITPTTVASLVHRGVREVAAGVDALHDAWREHNLRTASALGSRRSDDRLWIALGDSSQVGIGASRIDAGAVALAHRYVSDATGVRWHLVNLARHGAKVLDVCTEQIPHLHRWGRPDLVSVGVGANDVLWSWSAVASLEHFDRLLGALPPGAFVGTVPIGWRDKGRKINAYLRIQAAQLGLRISEAGVLPGGARWRAADRMHPNDLGYRFIADRMLDVMAPALGLGAQPRFVHGVGPLDHPGPARRR